MGFDSYNILLEQLNTKISNLQQKTNTGVEAINEFIEIVQQIESATSSSELQNILNNMEPSDFGMGDDLIENVNYYKGESRDIIINKLKKFVDTSNDKGIYYAALESLEPSINEYLAVYQIQNIKTITNNLGDIIDGKLSFKSQIQNTEKIMGFMADTMGSENISNLNKATNQLKGIIHNMKMMTDQDYNVDIEYLIDKYSSNNEIAENLKQINTALDEVCKKAINNFNSVINSNESVIPKKYW